MPTDVTTDSINGGKKTSIEVKQTKTDSTFIMRKGHLAQTDQTGGYTSEIIDLAIRVAHLEKKSENIGSLERRIEETIQALIEVQKEREIGSERVSPETLYRDESSIVKVRGIMRQGLLYLSDALSSYSEELERENYIDLFWNIILELQYFLIRTPMDPNLEEAITMLQVALYNHRTTPVKREEIVALKIVFEKFMDNIKLPGEILDKCLDKLEEAGFDLSGPLSKVEGLHELE